MNAPLTDDYGADSDDAAWHRAGHWLFAQQCAFTKGVVDSAELPPMNCVELAFAGRSNVGKSSLINALTGRRGLARASNTPGRTQEINFFALATNPQAAWLVDLPGYGYARESKKKIKAWTRLTRDYIRGRQALRRVFLLVDARHGIKSSDHEQMRLMDEAGVSYQIILTKADKPKPDALSALQADMINDLAKHVAAFPHIITTSAQSGSGIEDLRAEIATLVDLDALGYKSRE